MKDPTFDSVIREFRPRLMRYVDRRVDDRTVAEDLVQDILERALKSPRTEEDGVERWLFSIARNRVIDYYRSRGVRDRYRSRLVVEEHSHSTDDLFGQRPLGCIETFLKDLPDKYRRAVHAADIAGIRQRQLAKIEGISLSAAKSRVQRGRRQLRRSFEKCCRVEQDVRGGILSIRSRTSGEECRAEETTSIAC